MHPIYEMQGRFGIGAQQNLFIYAALIPSSQKVVADEESGVFSEETEWSLEQSFFNEISSVFGQFDIDLFASSINKKCPLFVSWFPNPLAFAIDAFSLNWGKFYFYAFPPFILILKTLRKIISDRAEGVLVVPWWPAQSWFPLFNQLVITRPIRFEPNINMLSSPFRDFHPNWTRISLVAARLSARPSFFKESRRRQ